MSTKNLTGRCRKITVKNDVTMPAAFANGTAGILSCLTSGGTGHIAVGKGHVPRYFPMRLTLCGRLHLYLADE